MKSQPEMIYEEMSVEEMKTELCDLADYFKKREAGPVKALMIISAMRASIEQSGVQIVTEGTRGCGRPNCPECSGYTGPVGHA